MNCLLKNVEFLAFLLNKWSLLYESSANVDRAKITPKNVRKIEMKSKKTLLLLLIGAAVILTVIWSTRNSNLTTIKPRILLATTTNSLAIPVKNPEDDKKVSSTFSSKASIVQEQCPLIPNVKADIDTSDLYPNLNFNVSYSSNWTFSFLDFLKYFSNLKKSIIPSSNQKWLFCQSCKSQKIAKFSNFFWLLRYFYLTN